MLVEATRERLRTLTVEVLLQIRREYLGTGASALKHWAQLQDRMRSAARTTTTPEEWATAMCRSLRLPALHSSTCSALMDLVHVVTEKKCATEWLDLIEREYGYLLALARLASEKAREQRGNEAV